jgi:GH24 family phage-related lysozyme (muramidase)
MVLRIGDSGDPVKALQRGLNKLGSILLVDGDFGASTGDAVLDARAALRVPGSAEADDPLHQQIAAVPDPFPFLSAAGVTFIARAEVTGPAEYRRQFRHPAWPSAASGITIGIGYDLQFVDRQQFAADWADVLPAESMDRLSAMVGKVGSAERLAQVRDIDAPLAGAVMVFLRRTLPRVVDDVRSIYPQLADLPLPRRTSLASLIYNRGTRLADRDLVRQDRREMRAIRDLLAAGDVNAVGEQLDAMARLWDPQKLAGLVRRRHEEATLWRDGFAALQLD